MALDRVALELAVERFELGTIISTPEERHGGVNRLWRVHTERGTFAVHELLGMPSHVDMVERCQRIFELETAVGEAGVRIARPIAQPDSGRAGATIDDTTGTVTVHEWVDAATVDGTTPTVAFAGELGAAVGRMHVLELPATAIEDDILEARPMHEDWLRLVDAASPDSRWAMTLEAATHELVEAMHRLDTWDSEDPAPSVFSHRDLTTQNVLVDDGHPVLIDWESAGPIGCGAEIGRTALDQFHQDGALDEELLRRFLGGYVEHRPVPAVGHDWCTLWIRGLIVFAYQCAQSCAEGSGPRSLLDFQAHVVETTPIELRRRMSIADDLVETLDRAARGG